MKNYYIGIDLGGTNIKGGIIDCGNIVMSSLIKTPLELGETGILTAIRDLCVDLVIKCNLSMSDIKGIGVAVPSIVDDKHESVICAPNLGVYNFNIKTKLEEMLEIKVKVLNDADAATIAEKQYGKGKNFKSFVLITIGTGIGSGVVINNKLIENIELGDMVIEYNGRQCTCGRKGCFEAYASATALKNDTIEVVKNNKSSLMNGEEISARTAFQYYDKDTYAKEIVDTYINYLSCGIINVIATFRPQAVLIGGGVSNEGENLIRRIVEKVKNSPFNIAEIDTADLKNNAGIVGAVEFFLKNS